MLDKFFSNRYEFTFSNFSNYLVLYKALRYLHTHSHVTMCYKYSKVLSKPKCQNQNIKKIWTKTKDKNNNLFEEILASVSNTFKITISNQITDGLNKIKQALLIRLENLIAFKSFLKLARLLWEGRSGAVWDKARSWSCLWIQFWTSFQVKQKNKTEYLHFQTAL